jgi:hypothetical protein
VIGNAIKVGRIATGEEPEDYVPDDGKGPAAKVLARRTALLARRACRLRDSGKSRRRRPHQKDGENSISFNKRIALDE